MTMLFVSGKASDLITFAYITQVFEVNCNGVSNMFTYVYTYQLIL